MQFGLGPPLLRNCYLVDDDGEPTLIDVGMPWDAARIREHLASVGYEVADVERVLITHYDYDHVGGLRRLARDLDAPVYLGERDYGIVAREYTPPLLHHKGAFHRVLRRLFPLPLDLQLRPLADGERVGGFVAYHTPGHNPGHTVYVHEGRSAGFLGDLAWEDGGALTTPMRMDSYSLAEVRTSVGKLAERTPPFEIACVGHGEPLTRGGSEALGTLAASLG